MRIPPALRKEIAGIPTWAWVLTLILFLAFVAWRKRQTAESEAYEDEELMEDAPGGTSPIVWPGPVTGPSEESQGFMSALDGLAERISDSTSSLTEQITGSEDNLSEQIGSSADRLDERIGGVSDQIESSTEAIVEAIGPGYNAEPPPTIPGPAEPPASGPGGKGNGQLPPKVRKLRTKRAQTTGAIKEIRRDGVTKKERDRLEQLRKKRERQTEKIKKEKAAAAPPSKAATASSNDMNAQHYRTPTRAHSVTTASSRSSKVKAQPIRRSEPTRAGRKRGR